MPYNTNGLSLIFKFMGVGYFGEARGRFSSLRYAGADKWEII
jgi:hypothetical protein